MTPLKQIITNEQQFQMQPHEIIWRNESNSEQLFFVSCYSDFDRLAHGPRGTEAENSIYIYRFNPTDGSMVLMNINGDKKELINPSFSRFHPRLNLIYTCTEDITENGKIICYAIGSNGNLTKISEVDAGGTSTCYLTIDDAHKHLLAVNYWDSTLVVIPISEETGEFIAPICNTYDPKLGIKVAIATKIDGGVNHSHNDELTIKMRQRDPHSHALVLDPYVGCIAFVPCLGKDVIREFFYDEKEGVIVTELNSSPSSINSGEPNGPRYVEFHQVYNKMYVVNELSSTVAVFQVDKRLIFRINAAVKNGESIDQFKMMSTLKLIQSISTIPNAFPKKMNTCGRICVHNSGRFVAVSNRGHQSVVILRVKDKGFQKGQLVTVGYFHTRGECPRHFQFDASGQYLIVANQDTDNLSIFNFNQCSGEITFTGNEYRVPSPNFICNCPIRDEFDLQAAPISDDEFSLFGRGDMSNPSSTESSASSSFVDKKELEIQLQKSIADVESLKKQLALLSP